MNEEFKKYMASFIIGWIIILIILMLLQGCTCKKIACPTYKDNYKRHWMNKRNGTNILFSDYELKSKWHKKKN